MSMSSYWLKMDIDSTNDVRQHDSCGSKRGLHEANQVFVGPYDVQGSSSFDCLDSCIEDSSFYSAASVLSYELSTTFVPAASAAIEVLDTSAPGLQPISKRMKSCSEISDVQDTPHIRKNSNSSLQTTLLRPSGHKKNRNQAFTQQEFQRFIIGRM